MGALQNARHELFAQALAKGKTADEAYAAAGFQPDRGNASRLTSKDSVRARVDEIKSKAAARVVVTVESLAHELEEARALALGEKQSSAAVQATMGKAKLFGLGSENRRVTASVRFVDVDPAQIQALSDDELAALRAALPVLEKLGVLGGDDLPSAGEAEA